jgi:hypothetical protein
MHEVLEIRIKVLLRATSKYSHENSVSNTPEQCYRLAPDSPQDWIGEIASRIFIVMLVVRSQFRFDCYLLDRNNIAQTNEINSPSNTKASNAPLSVIMNIP